MALPLVKYPVGIQSFESIRKEDFIYVDKTDLIYTLVHTSKCVFLSRPRRFGKSLLLSTIKAYFEGKKELFKGLAMERLESDWEKFPVLTLSLAQYNPQGDGNLEGILNNQFLKWESEYDVKIKSSDLSIRFGNIIEAVYEATGQQAVVLIDEYDSPIIGNLEDPQKQENHRELLKSVYVNLKNLDSHIRFTMLTGVSRFSKMTVFSGLNNLMDISLNTDYSAICGITEDELYTYFQEGILKFADEYDTDFNGAVSILKDNYDGYHFSRNCPDIYNPYSLLCSFFDGDIGSYWFQSGTLEFLVKKIRRSGSFLPKLFDGTVMSKTLSATDISRATVTALLYQTGYLTIKDYEAPDRYHLGIPNLEVRKGLFEDLASYSFHTDDDTVNNNVYEVRQLLEAGDIDQAMERLQTFMAGIPYEFADKAPELHYENNLFIIFMLIGVDARPEWHTSHGRIDMLLKMRNYIYIVELKLDKAPEKALAQIEKKDYARQFKADPRPLVRVGVTFSTETRNISAWSVERDEG